MFNSAATSELRLLNIELQPRLRKTCIGVRSEADIFLETDPCNASHFGQRGAAFCYENPAVLALATDQSHVRG